MESTKKLNQNENAKFKPFVFYNQDLYCDLENKYFDDYTKITELNDFFLELSKFILRRSPASEADEKGKKTKGEDKNFDEIMREYIENCLYGNFILLKPFSFVLSTHFTRIGFVYHFSQVFNLENEGSNFNGNDYFQLVRLICGDFPKELINYSIQFIINEENCEESFNVLIPGKTFIRSLFLNLVFKEFCEESKKILEESKESKHYATRIFKFYEELQAKSMLPAFYAPPMGLIYAVLLQLSNESVNKKIIVFSKKLLRQFESKSQISFVGLMNAIINESSYSRMLKNQLEVFELVSPQNKKLKFMEEVLNDDNTGDSGEENDNIIIE